MSLYKSRQKTVTSSNVGDGYRYLLSYQQSRFGSRQQRDPAPVDEKVAFERPARELPEKQREGTLECLSLLLGFEILLLCFGLFKSLRQRNVFP